MLNTQGTGWKSNSLSPQISQIQHPSISVETDGDVKCSLPSNANPYKAALTICKVFGAQQFHINILYMKMFHFDIMLKNSVMN